MRQAALSNARGSLPSARIRLGKWLTWTAWLTLGGVGVYFIYTNAVQYLTMDQAAYGRYWPYRFWLLAHVLGGMTALLVGPLQFWTGFRKRNFALHRLTGKVYLGAISLGSAAAFYLSTVYTSTYSWTFGVSLFVLGVAWLATSTMAFVSIKKKNVPLHKEWMIRSYVVTFAFVVFRLIEEFDMVWQLGTQAEVLTTAGWVCWTLPLIGTEMILSYRKLERK